VSECIAVLNAGSSSIKFALYKEGSGEPASYRGQIEGIGISPSLTIKDAAGGLVADQKWPQDGLDHRQATEAIFKRLIELLGGTPVSAVGHRVVHGGTDFAVPTRVDEQVMGKLRALSPLAPLHQPHNLAPIDALTELAPHIPQVACFDTAFHQNQPELAQLFAIPRELTKAGVRRYGFHGLSYQYIAKRLAETAPDMAKGRVLVAHLGNGASLCALRNGQSVATTMGFTAVDGLMMGTRCGSIDPGVLLYLMDERKMDARAIEDMIYRKSGLLGVSGISADMRSLLASDDPAAAQAISLFIYRIVREIGSLSAAMEGLDALVFTGGIGERSAAVRTAVAKGCGWLGVATDETDDGAGERRIDAPNSKVAVWVMPTDEEGMMARLTADVLGLSPAKASGYPETADLGTVR
jgi:acetate kinase